MENTRFDVVDFHSHILPGADHGSSSVDTSLKQLKLASEADVTRIIATPHFYPHRHTLDKFLQKREECATALYNACAGTLPVVKIGAEVLLCEGLEKLPGLEKLCLAGTEYLLIELPFSDFRHEYCDTIEKIQKIGLKVILAHVDRYAKENIEQLIDIGVDRLQVNADSLDKMFKPKHILDWAKRGYVIALGSDIHNDDAKAYKHFTKAKSVLGDSLEIVRKKSDDIFNSMK
jgi:protein-tyrosine phosphatase